MSQHDRQKTKAVRMNSQSWVSRSDSRMFAMAFAVVANSDTSLVMSFIPRPYHGRP